MGAVLRLPEMACDYPGCTSIVVLPQLTARLTRIVMMGRKAEDVQEIGLRVNGLELLRFAPASTEDGEYLSGGQVAQLVAGLLGPVHHKGTVLHLGDGQGLGEGLDMRGAHVALSVKIAAGASITGRLQCFAFVQGLA